MKYKKIGEFIELSQGLAINRETNHLVSEVKDDKHIYPLLRIADMIENSFGRYISNDVKKSVISKKEDIIYTRTGQIGLAFKGYEGVVHNNSFIVRLVSDEIDKDYLFTVLNTEFVRKQALNLAKNSVQPDLTHDMFKSLVIPVPSKELQRKISKIYFFINDKIKNNNKINDELESMAKTLYDYWFLQFEFPNEEGKPYKSSGGKMVWNDELKREIPVGWEVEELKNIFTFIKGKIPEKLYDEKGENLYPYVTIEMASNGTCQYCEKENMQLCNGEVLMVMDGAASGNIFLGSKGVLGSTLAMLGRRRVDFSNSMIYCILDSNKEIYKKANTGSTVPHANRKFIEGMKIATPKKMSDFSSKFDSIFNIIITNKEQNKELQELRDFLLPMLMNGQIGFKEDKELAEANA